jgi:hypothetical protein
MTDLPDEDQRKLAALREAFGAQPVEIGQYFSSPGREPAELAEELRALGFEVVVDEEVTGDGFWHIAAFRKESFTTSTLSVLRARIVELATLHDAKYDGWEWRTTLALQVEFPDAQGQRSVVQAPSEVVVRHSGWLLAFISVFLLGWGVVTINLAVQKAWAFALLFALIGGGLGVWYLRARVTADTDGLHVRNAWRTVHLPWADVRSLDVWKGGPGHNPFGRTIVATRMSRNEVWLDATWRTVMLDEVDVLRRRLGAWQIWAATVGKRPTSG